MRLRDFFARPFWTWTDYAALFLCVGFVATAAIPSGWFIRPISYDFEDGLVTFHRETPFGTVWATWDTTIIRLDGSNLECNNAGFTDYQVEPLDFVQYPLGERMLPCVEGGPPFRVKQKWRVWAGYSYLPISIPLRPHTHTFLVD